MRKSLIVILILSAVLCCLVPVNSYPGSSEQTQKQGRQNGSQPNGQRQSGSTPNGQRPSGSTPNGQRQSGSTPNGQRPSGPPPSGMPQRGPPPNGARPPQMSTPTARTG